MRKYRKEDKRFRIVVDWTGGRFGIIDQRRALRGQWCHEVHMSIRSAMLRIEQLLGLIPKAEWFLSHPEDFQLSAFQREGKKV